MGLAEGDGPKGVIRHVTDHLVDQLLGSALVPLLAHLVANNDVDPEGKGFPLPLRVSEGVLRDVGSLATLPLLALTGAQAHRGDDRVSLSLEPAQGLVLVELPVEVEAPDLDPGAARLREHAPHPPLAVAALAEIAKGHGEPEIGEEEIESGIVVGPMSAA